MSAGEKRVQGLLEARQCILELMDGLDAALEVVDLELEALEGQRSPRDEEGR